MRQAEFVHSTVQGDRRRRTPRIEVLGYLHGQLVAMDIPISVRNMGAGGFGIESPVAFPIGATHTFRFTAQTGLRAVVSATVRHCEALPEPDGRNYYRAGFEFIHDANGETGRAIEALLEAMTSILMLQ